MGGGKKVLFGVALNILFSDREGSSPRVDSGISGEMTCSDISDGGRFKGSATAGGDEAPCSSERTASCGVLNAVGNARFGGLSAEVRGGWRSDGEPNDGRGVVPSTVPSSLVFCPNHEPSMIKGTCDGAF